MSDQLICNICGRELDIFEADGPAEVRSYIGYGSRHDGEILRLTMCYDCLDRIIDSCKVSPIVGEWDI